MRPVMLRGSGRRSVVCSCLLGGLAVDPFDLANFRSGKTMLLSLLIDLRFQISGRCGELVRDIGLSRMFVCASRLGSSLSFGGSGGWSPSDKSPDLSESFASLLLSFESVRDNPGLSEYTDDKLRIEGGLAGWVCPPTGRRGIVFGGGTASFGRGGRGDWAVIIVDDFSFSVDAGSGATGRAFENRGRPLGVEGNVENIFGPAAARFSQYEINNSQRL